MFCLILVSNLEYIFCLQKSLLTLKLLELAWSPLVNESRKSHRPWYHTQQWEQSPYTAVRTINHRWKLPKLWAKISPFIFYKLIASISYSCGNLTNTLWLKHKSTSHFNTDNLWHMINTCPSIYTLQLCINILC